MLVENNKGQNQRNNKIVFWPAGSEMVFARDARSTKPYSDGHVDIRPFK